MKGFSKFENDWLYDFMTRLPTAQAVELLLQSRAHFRVKGLDLGQIISALKGRDVRTVERVVESMTSKGSVVLKDGLLYSASVLAAEAMDRVVDKGVDALIPNSSKTPARNAVQHAKREALTKGNEGKEVEVREQHNTPRPPAQSPARPDRTGVQRSVQTQTPTPAGTTPFKALEEAITLACYGSAEGLTGSCITRIGRAANDLKDAGYAADDVPAIVKWIQANEKWRTSALSPQVIAEKAPAWKQGKSGNLTLPTTGYVRGQEEFTPAWKFQAEIDAEIERLLNEVAL